MQNNQHEVTKSQFAGLIPLLIIMTILLLSPVLYFLINLLLGHADMLAINGAR